MSQELQSRRTVKDKVRWHRNDSYGHFYRPRVWEGNVFIRSVCVSERSGYKLEYLDVETFGGTS